MPATAPRTETLDLRLTASAKQTLHAAAAATRRSVSEFVLDSALARAEETLSMRRHFGLNSEKWEAFVAALDGEPRELPRLEALLKSPSVFEGGPTS